ncbi:Exocyst complex component SEC3A [Platanthera guangdongensis]|uniref:Exocyst complex component SEC3A n=1 Tax=Platanthera guangdongensis TaxID=2320717 RepID=A0ABR2MIY0_9ASPA
MWLSEKYRFFIDAPINSSLLDCSLPIVDCKEPQTQISDQGDSTSSILLCYQFLLCPFMYHIIAQPFIILSRSTKQSNPTFLQIPMNITRNREQPAKLYKLRHLTKVEVVPNDNSGCTFMLGFDNLRSQSVTPPQWTMRNIDDRFHWAFPISMERLNRLLFGVLNVCKEITGHLPKVVGIDVVEMAIWAKENIPAVINEAKNLDDPVAYVMTQTESQVTVERELVSQAEEEDMEALLGT